MNTLTPRTDEARRIDNGDTRPLLDEMETMERELHESRNAERLARVQLAAEREKVQALRLACERIVNQWDADHDANPIGAGGRMYTLASAALSATEDAQ